MEILLRIMLSLLQFQIKMNYYILQIVKKSKVITRLSVKTKTWEALY